jgi:hypothetical protein
MNGDTDTGFFGGTNIIGFTTGGVEAARFDSSQTLVLGSNDLTTTGTISLTGARITQAFFTNHTTTNAETVDSWGLSKQDISLYQKSALDILRKVDVISFRHLEDRDPTLRLKMGVRAETISEPLATPFADYGRGLGRGPQVDMMGLAALNTKGIQELHDRIEVLEAQLALN